MTDKEKIRAYIESQIALLDKNNIDNPVLGVSAGIVMSELKHLLSFIDSLQEDPVSEDLEAEFDRYCDTLYLIDLENEPYAELFECAKYFFELGLKTQRKISYVPNIDDSLKELGIDPSSKEAKIFKESYCAALDKFMAQKGK